jgi:hypothetical protein
MGVSYRSANIKYFTLLWLRVVNMLAHISQTFRNRDKSALGLKHLNFYFINFNQWKNWITLAMQIMSMQAAALYTYIQAVLNSNLTWATDRRGRDFVVSISTYRGRTLGYALTAFLYILTLLYLSISIQYYILGFLTALLNKLQIVHF